MLILIPKKRRQPIAPSEPAGRRRLLRFSLKSLLFTVTLLAVLLATLLQGYRYLVRREAQRSLTRWARNAQNHSGVSELVSTLGSPGATFYVANTRMEWRTLDDGREGWVIPGEAEKDPDGRFFIVPPGKWVNSVDEIIDGWQQHPKGADPLPLVP